MTDTQGNFVQVSPSAMTILGYQPSEMIGHTAIEFIHPDDLDSTRNEMRSARRGRQIRNFEARYIHKDGRAVTLTWMGTWSEPVQRYFFVGRDLTEQQATEAQMRHVQKMERGRPIDWRYRARLQQHSDRHHRNDRNPGRGRRRRRNSMAIAKLIDEAAERGVN